MSTQTPISGLTALGAAPASNDLLPVVDVSDTDQASTGTLKKMTVANLFNSPSIATPSLTGISTIAALIVTGDASIDGTLGISGIATMACASASVTINSTSGSHPAVLFQESGTQHGGIASTAANTVCILDGSSSIIATFNAGAMTLPNTLTISAGGITVSSGTVVTAASTTAGAGLRLPSGTAPTSPVNGDVWFDGGAVKIQISGATKTFTVA